MRAGKFISREEEESKYTKQSTTKRLRDGEIPEEMALVLASS